MASQEKKRKEKHTPFDERNTRMVSARIEESVYKKLRAQDLSVRQLIIRALDLKHQDEVYLARIERLEELCRAMDFKVKYAYVAAQEFYRQRNS